MADLNLSADVTELVRARQEIRKWSKETSDAISIVNSRMKVLGDTSPVAINKMNAAMGNMRKGMSRSSVAMQQFGYQAGDFLVQVQSGTNAFVAFGQQATQMAGLLTMSLNPKILGLGVALSILIPLATAAGAAFMRTRDAAEDTSNKIEQIDESLKEYQKTLEASARGMTLDQLFATDELGRAEAELERLKILAEEVGSGVSFRGLGESFVSMLSGLSFGLLDLTIEGKVETYEELVAAAEERLAALRERRDNEAAQRRREYAMETETDLRNQIQIMQVQLQHGEDSLEVEKARAEQARQAFLLEVMREGIYGEQLQRLTELYDKQAELNAIMNMPVYGPEDPRGQGTGGGTTGRSAVREGVGGVARGLLTEVERLQLEHDEKMAAIEEFNQQELDVIGGHQEAIRRLEEQHQAAMREIQDKENDAKLQGYSSFFGALASVTAQGGDKFVKATRIFKAAETLINAWTAYGQVLADPTLPFFAKVPAALSVLSAGLGAVNAIKSGSSSSGGGGAGAVAAPAAVAAPEPQQVIIEGIDRDSLISGEQLSKLFDRLYEENDERGIVFSVAR